MLGLVEPFVHLEWRRVRELVEPLQRARDTIVELRSQNESLKEQVREEVERRIAVEEELQACERARSENQALRTELDSLRRSADDAGRLVKSSRRLQRQQADELLAIRTENCRLSRANEDVGSLEEEVASLRALVCEKDAAVQRQRRTMEALKTLIQRLRQTHSGVNETIDEFFGKPTSEEEEEEEEEEDDGEIAEAERRRRLLNSRPKSGAAATVRVHSRGSMGQPRSVSATSNYSVGDLDKRPSQPVSRASIRTDGTTPDAGRSPQAATGGLSKQRVDAIASIYLQLGSRVTVRVQGSHECGTVKYIGLAAHIGDKKDSVLVGIRLRFPVGNTDGTHRGVRYFAAPAGYGLFVRAHRVLSVFNPKKNRYVNMDDCVRAYLKLHR